MYNESFSHTNKSLQTDSSFSLQMVQTKLNLYLSLPIYSLISTYNIKDKNNK